MTTCPNEDEIVLLVSGEQTENRAAELGRHIEACRPCESVLESIRQLQADIAMDVPGGSPAQGAAAVMRRIRSTAQAEAQAPRGHRWFGLGLGPGAAVLSAAVALLVVRGTAGDERKDAYQARGGIAKSALSKLVGVDFFVLRDGAFSAVSAGSSMRSDEGLTISYVNSVRDQTVYLQAFVIDREREIHWIYPAFADAESDPAAIELLPSSEQKVMPETTVMDEPATGAASLVWIVSTEQTTVSAVEGLPREKRTVQSLRKRWPESEVGFVGVRIED